MCLQIRLAWEICDTWEQIWGSWVCIPNLTGIDVWSWKAFTSSPCLLPEKKEKSFSIQVFKARSYKLPKSHWSRMLIGSTSLKCMTQANSNLWMHDSKPQFSKPDFLLMREACWCQSPGTAKLPKPPRMTNSCGPVQTACFNELWGLTVEGGFRAEEGKQWYIGRSSDGKAGARLLAGI